MSIDVSAMASSNAGPAFSLAYVSSSLYAGLVVTMILTVDAESQLTNKYEYIVSERITTCAVSGHGRGCSDRTPKQPF